MNDMDNTTDLSVKPEGYPPPAKGGPFTDIDLAAHPEKGALSITIPRSAKFLVVADRARNVAIAENNELKMGINL